MVKVFVKPRLRSGHEFDIVKKNGELVVEIICKYCPNVDIDNRLFIVKLKAPRYRH